MLRKLPISVQERIGFYVYALVDPRDSEIFYVGKGIGDRLFSHVNDELDRADSSDFISNKIDRIRDIRNQGFEVDHFVVRHGLSEKGAFEVEAALIDFVGLTGLTNLVRGYDSDDRGRMSVNEMIAKYEAIEANITEPVILVTINKYYRREMPADILYEMTRGNWKLSQRREKAKYAFAVYRGIIREVYRIDRWYPQTHDSEKRKKWIFELTGEIFDGGKTRWQFDGVIAAELQHYKYCSTGKDQTVGAQNPIRYVNC